MASVLFIVPELSLGPNLGGPPIPFLERQLRMLKEAGSLCAIATTAASKSTIWLDTVPIHALVDQNQMRRVWRGALRRLHLPVHYPTRADILNRTLPATRCDTILCHYGTLAFDLELAFSKSSAKLFIHVHGYDTIPTMCPPNYVEALLRLSERGIILCNSQETRSRLLRFGIADDRLIVKYLGVEVPDTPLRHGENTEVTILQLGRLVDCKSPDRTIRAFELACERGLQGSLVLAGDGPLREKCEELRTQSKWRDRMKLLGVVNRAEGQKLRAEADIFTVHSIRGDITGQIEAFGVAVVEAMADALPIVSCRIGGLLETVIDGVTGILVEPSDIEGQANAFIQLAQNPGLRRKMGEAGWQRARDNFSYTRERQQLLAILNDESGTR